MSPQTDNYAFQALMDKINSTIGDGLSALGSFTVDGWGWLWDKLKKLIAKLSELAVKVFDEIKACLADPGWPPALWKTAQRWTDELQSKVSPVTNQLTLGSMESTKSWSGAAAEQYQIRLLGKGGPPLQSQAVGSYADGASDVSGILVDSARTLTYFWLEVAGIVAALVVALIKAARGIASVGAALLAVAQAIGAVITAAGLFLAADAKARSDLAEHSNRLRGIFNDNKALSGGGALTAGNWPQPVLNVATGQ
ncbi:hypothetical protein GCM10027589_25310 [Actinocorallia lasiicapitis]